MITLKDGSQWPDEDHHAQNAKGMGCTRAEAKSRLFIWVYAKPTKFSVTNDREWEK